MALVPNPRMQPTGRGRARTPDGQLVTSMTPPNPRLQLTGASAPGSTRHCPPVAGSGT
jgi:hypothetical protein